MLELGPRAQGRIELFILPGLAAHKGRVTFAGDIQQRVEGVDPRVIQRFGPLTHLQPAEPGAHLLHLLRVIFIRRLPAALEDLVSAL